MNLSIVIVDMQAGRNAGGGAAGGIADRKGGKTAEGLET
jgi:hypothetical protein